MVYVTIDIISLHRTMIGGGLVAELFLAGVGSLEKPNWFNWVGMT